MERIGLRDSTQNPSRAVARVRAVAWLDAIHLASADPFRAELSAFVTYDQELAKAAADLGFRWPHRPDRHGSMRT